MGKECAVKTKIGELALYIPNVEDGWFYQKMLSDPATMAYNAKWFPPDGCIPNAPEEWKSIQAEWIDASPKRFYAYLKRTFDGAFVGDVNYHFNPSQNNYDMGIVIYAPERGKGYGKQGLELLLERAFKVDGISRLHNEFETSRDAAYRIHKAVGFKEIGKQDGIISLEITREEYFQRVIGTKILVIGAPGSGKSTFAKKLQKVLGLPLVHLDNVWWNSDRTHVSREEFDRRLKEILRAPKWIVDGSYSRTYEVRFKACDTIFYLDFDEETCMNGIIGRVGQQRDDIPWTENTLDPELVELVKSFNQKNRPVLYALIEKYKEKSAYIFKTRAQADEWLNRLTK
ncbi:MAG: GNAT family N-acetyltransferase [Clostridia bacterium]|nr:GNAT family N-acetyltransferase [Clostridia bacterium]